MCTAAGQTPRNHEYARYGLQIAGTAVKGEGGEKAYRMPRPSASAACILHSTHTRAYVGVSTVTLASDCHACRNGGLCSVRASYSFAVQMTLSRRSCCLLMMIVPWSYVPLQSSAGNENAW